MDLSAESRGPGLQAEQAPPLQNATNDTGPTTPDQPTTRPTTTRPTTNDQRPRLTT